VGTELMCTYPQTHIIKHVKKKKKKKKKFKKGAIANCDVCAFTEWWI
jgi:hypothetical protein